MVEVKVDVRYISLHRCIRNTPSDTENACKTPAESRQEYRTSRKEYTEPCKTHRMWVLGAQTGVLVGQDLPSAGGGTEAGV